MWRAIFISPSGSATIYEKEFSHLKDKVTLPYALLPDNFVGLVNTGSEYISAQTNLKNLSVEFDRQTGKADSHNRFSSSIYSEANEL